MTATPSEVTPWRLARPRADYTIAHVRAVLPDRVIDNATVVVRDGRIAAVQDGRRSAQADLDGCHLLLMPGLIDVHTDALERERVPRPNTTVPWDFALTSFESRLVGAGITTVFHGAGFQHSSAHGKPRTVQSALELSAVVDAAGGRRIDHRVLHRMDVRSRIGADALRTRLESMPFGDVPPLVSHEDHTPGQGQYVDRSYMERYIVGVDGKSEQEARAQVDDIIAEAAHTEDVREDNLRWLGELARAGRIRLLGHDPDTGPVVDALTDRGGTTAEFPTTLEAAQRARERKLLIVAGAPNVLRGVSHSGNISARQLVGEGYADALASDYLPTALLGAVFTLVAEGLATLPQAVRLVTAGPAQVAGLADRGVLAEGMRADLILVDDRTGAWPHAVTSLTAAQPAETPTESVAVGGAHGSAQWIG